MSDTDIHFVGFKSAIVKAESYGISAQLYLAEPPVVPPVEPPPTGLKYYTVHNIACTDFSVKKTTLAVGEDLWFHFVVSNIGQIPVGYEILAPRTEDNDPVKQCAQSWTRETLQPGQVLSWDDHIKFNTPGTYHFYMGCGFENKDELVVFREPWFRLSDSITLIVQ